MKKQTKFKKIKEFTPVRIGEIYTFTINALGTGNVGLVELPSGYTVIVPNAKLGDEVKVQIKEVVSTKPKYATSKVLSFITKKNLNPSVQVGEKLNCTITKAGPKNSGLVQLSNNYNLIIPNTKVGDQVQVEIIRVKTNYAFGQVVKSKMFTPDSNENLTPGSKFTVKLPKTAKVFANHIVIKLNGSIVFIKMELGVKLGDNVKIQILTGKQNSFAVAKILKISPFSKQQKQKMVQNSLRKMLKSGLHFGEKAIRCHANMRKFIWYRKKGNNKNRPLIKRGRHLINVLKTRRCLTKSLSQLAKYAAKGKTFLFVGTKKPAAALIARAAMLSKTSFFINTRWLGGMLTNWKTILKSISQIKPILREKQRIIKNILEKRQQIQTRLIKKVNLLRKRSKKLMTKAKVLINKLKQNQNVLMQKSQKLSIKKTQLVQRNKLLVQKYKQVGLLKYQLVQQCLLLQNKGNLLIQQKQNLINQLIISQKQKEEFLQLFLIGQELVKLQASSIKEGKVLSAISYSQINKLASQTENWMIPNPSKEILNKMMATMKMTFETNSNITVKKSSQLDTNRVKAEQVATQTVVLSKLLHKFTRFLPFIKNYVKSLILRIENMKTLLININTQIQTVREKLNEYCSINTVVVFQLQAIRTKFMSERHILKTLKTKARKLAAEQRLLKFLPRLRYLPTPKNQMADTIQILMTKFVDPKLSDSMDHIYDEKLKFTSKKIAAIRKQKWQRLEKYFGGVTKMAKMNKKYLSNNVAIIIGQQEEMNAVQECQKLGIKMFTIVDTNCNPKMSDYIIPANDDSRNSIKFVLGEMLTYIRLAQKLRKKVVSKKTRKY